MPFTPAHPAITLPFFGIRKPWMSATALVLGSMIPDFEYFIFFSPDDHFGHTLLGILYFDVPLVIIVAFLFHGIVKKPLLENTPEFIRARFQTLLAFDFRCYFKKYYLPFIGLSVIGITSHLLLDAFTHAHGVFVKDNPFLLKGIFHFQGAKYPYYYVAQYVASYVGMIWIALYVILQKPQPGYKNSLTGMIFYWLLVGAVMTVILWVRISLYQDERFENIVIDSLASLIYGLILAGLTWVNNQTSRTR